MRHLIRSKFKRPRQYYFSSPLLPLGYRWKLTWGTKLFSGHQSYTERAVFVDREEAFVVRQDHKYPLNLVNLRPVFWIIARKYDSRFAPLIAPCAYHAPNRPNGHVSTDVFQRSI
jgi:hypothetical protein